MQIEARSVRLLMLCGLFMFCSIKSFSDRHKLQCFCPGLYVWDFFKIDHWMGGSIISPSELQFSLFVQINFERVVEFCLFVSLKVCLWHVILSFIWPEVRPM